MMPQICMDKKRFLAWFCLWGLIILTAGCITARVPPSPSLSLSQPPVASPSRETTSTPDPRPGLILRGNVRLANGQGLADARIFIALASYAGKIAAVTDSNGDYQSEFQFIPGEEMIRVWAELDGYAIMPEEESQESGEYFWRHYFGLETLVLNFLARPSAG